jgi:hypothetical protein
MSDTIVSSLGWICRSESGWAAVAIPTGLFIASELVALIPEEKLKANSLLGMIFNLVKNAYLKKTENQPNSPTAQV